MPSGPIPPHGLQVTVTSGPIPPHGRALSGAAGPNPQPSHRRSASARPNEAESFTRTEIVSVRLEARRPRPFSIVISTDTPGKILIESVEVSICEEDEPVFNIPVSDSSVVLKKRDNRVFRLTDQQLAAISEHLEHGNTVKIRVRYLAEDESELTISIIEKDSHHRFPYVLAIIAVGFALQSILKRSSHSE
jgi:hypothetical protein